MKEDDFRIVALEFAKVVSEKARDMFKTKEECDGYIIEYYIVEIMRFFFGYPLILFYINLRIDKELREILNLKVLKSFSNYEDFRKKSHRTKVRINNMIKRNCGIPNYIYTSSSHHLLTNHITLSGGSLYQNALIGSSQSKLL